VVVGIVVVTAGFAPAFGERRLDDPAAAAVRQAIDLVLRGHEPYPAVAIDRHWTLVAANRIVPTLLAGLDAELLTPPVNVLRLSLHPNGLAPRIANLPQWRSHLLERLKRQIAASGDPGLEALHEELVRLPGPRVAGARLAAGASPAESLVVPLQLRTPDGTLALISTTTVFGTPVDVALSELALECFYPADAESAELLRRLAAR